MIHSHCSLRPRTVLVKRCTCAGEAVIVFIVVSERYRAGGLPGYIRPGFHSGFDHEGKRPRRARDSSTVVLGDTLAMGQSRGVPDIVFRSRCGSPHALRARYVERRPPPAMDPWWTVRCPQAFALGRPYVWRSDRAAASPVPHFRAETGTDVTRHGIFPLSLATHSPRAA
jgi:hypothetical protein